MTMYRVDCRMAASDVSYIVDCMTHPQWQSVIQLVREGQKMEWLKAQSKTRLHKALN